MTDMAQRAESVKMVGISLIITYGVFQGTQHTHTLATIFLMQKFTTRYIPYAVGGGYILGKTIVEYLAINFHMVPPSLPPPPLPKKCPNLSRKVL